MHAQHSTGWAQGQNRPWKATQIFQIQNPLTHHLAHGHDNQQTYAAAKTHTTIERPAHVHTAHEPLNTIAASDFHSPISTIIL